MPKDKKVGATSIASPRSRKKTDENDFNKKQDTTQELPDWAKDLPDEIVVKTWEID
tara:strand:+ start:1267 stop:1434 length:168 start_codon:yes stop_codon:yes gene_type:complete